MKIHSILQPQKLFVALCFVVLCVTPGVGPHSGSSRTCCRRNNRFEVVPDAQRSHAVRSDEGTFLAMLVVVDPNLRRLHRSERQLARAARTRRENAHRLLRGHDS